MFQIKICGITNASDAASAAAAGANAIGLNFYAQSRRYLPGDAARLVAEAVRSPVVKVGVFVNASAQEIVDAAKRVDLQCAQLHGDESAETLARLPAELSLVRAYRCGARGLAPLATYLDECRAHGRLPDAVLIDADGAAGEYGGTGSCVDWELLARERGMLGEVSLILAGGLTPQNVAAAIEAVRPQGVDVASGVESKPGRKDPAKVRDFVAAARKAFERFA